jgi:hypothetical protein
MAINAGPARNAEKIWKVSSPIAGSAARRGRNLLDAHDDRAQYRAAHASRHGSMSLRPNGS